MPPLMLMASAYRKRPQLSTKWGWKFRNRRLRAVFSAPELAGKDGNVDIYLRLLGDLGLDDTILIHNDET